MYNDTIDHFANLARNKADTLLHRPLAFLTGALMAGAYVGIGIRQIKAFRDGERNDPMMAPMVKPLTDKGIADIAAYYASLKS